MGEPDDVLASTEEALRASMELLDFLRSVEDDVSRALADSRRELRRSRDLIRSLVSNQTTNSD